MRYTPLLYGFMHSAGGSTVNSTNLFVFLLSLAFCLSCSLRGESATQKSKFLQPGTSFEIKRPEKVTTGLKNLGDTRYVPFKFIQASAQPADSGLSFSVEDSVVHVFANTSAQGKEYRVTVVQLSKEQMYRNVGPRPRWVDTLRTKSVPSSIKVFVEIESLPKVTIPAGTSVYLDVPGFRVGWRVVKKNSAVASVTQAHPNTFRIEGKKSGRVTFKLTYRLGNKKLSKKLQVNVQDEDLARPAEPEEDEPPLITPQATEPGKVARALACDACNRTGRIECPACKGGEGQCHHCDREGKRPCDVKGCEEGRITCVQCKKGLVTKIGETIRSLKTCKNCKGKKTTDCPGCDNGRVTCERCGGKAKPDCALCRNAGTVECARCNIWLGSLVRAIHTCTADASQSLADYANAVRAYETASVTIQGQDVNASREESSSVRSALRKLSSRWEDYDRQYKKARRIAAGCREARKESELVLEDIRRLLGELQGREPKLKTIEEIEDFVATYRRNIWSLRDQLELVRAQLNDVVLAHSALEQKRHVEREKRRRQQEEREALEESYALEEVFPRPSEKGSVMSEEHLASIIRSAIWAAAFVISVCSIAPILRYWAHRSSRSRRGS